jgi:hypothetical protein
MTIDAWSNFFVAQCGASAALLGLLFVSVSLNLKQILAFPQLPGRAALAMLLLLTILVVALLMLIPGQTAVANAIEILGGGVSICGAAIAIKSRDLRRSASDWRLYFIRDTALLAVATLPYFVAAALMLSGSVAALYWLAAAMLLSILKSMSDSWVLLVEINR